MSTLSLTSTETVEETPPSAIPAAADMRWPHLRRGGIKSVQHVTGMCNKNITNEPSYERSWKYFAGTSRHCALTFSHTSTIVESIQFSIVVLILTSLTFYQHAGLFTSGSVDLLRRDELTPVTPRTHNTFADRSFCGCETIYRLSCDRTSAADNSNNSNDNWKHFCSWLTDHDALWLFVYLHLRNILTQSSFDCYVSRVLSQRFSRRLCKVPLQ